MASDGALASLAAWRETGGGVADAAGATSAAAGIVTTGTLHRGSAIERAGTTSEPTSASVQIKCRTDAEARRIREFVNAKTVCIS